MIGVDTNVFVRFLVLDDDAEQRRKVSALFDVEEAIFVGHVVLAESLWLLLNSYRYPPEAVRDALLRAAQSPVLVFEDSHDLFRLLASGELSVRAVADYLIAASARQNGCVRTITFDRRAARDVPGMELLQ